MPGLAVCRRRGHEQVLAAAAGEGVDVTADGIGVEADELADRVETARGQPAIRRIVVQVAADPLDFRGQFLAADTAIEHRYLLVGPDRGFDAGEGNLAAAPDIKYPRHCRLCRFADTRSAP